jgi:hypothetical protein
MTAGRTLVVGSYPPVPGEPAAATVAAVRRAWAAGRDVVVASPRPSAAPYVVALSGAAVGRELTKLRLTHACDQVVLCLEPGWPFARPTGGSTLRAAQALARGLSGPRKAELVVTGELEIPSAVLALLWPSVELVTASSGELAAHLRDAGAPQVRVVEPFAAAGVRPPARQIVRGAVGPLEPAELLVVARGRRFLGLAARKLLGKHAPAVRLYLRRFLRPGFGARRS